MSEEVIRTVLFRDGKVVGRLTKRQGRTVYTFVKVDPDTGAERVHTRVYGEAETSHFMTSLGDIQEKPSFLTATNWQLEGDVVKITLVHSCVPAWNHVIRVPFVGSEWKTHAQTGLTPQLIALSQVMNTEVFVANWGKIRV